MAWTKNGSTTLSSAGDDITVSSLSSSKLNFTLAHQIASGNLDNIDVNLNNDSGSVYADRESTNGGADSTQVSQTGWRMSHGNASWDYFNINYIVSVSGEEKLLIGFFMSNNGSGAGSAPNRNEHVAKYVPSPDANITSINYNNAGTGDYDTGSNVSVLGSELTTASAKTIETGSIYIDTDTGSRCWYDGSQWIQTGLYITATGGTITTDGDYKIHTFTEDDTFTVTSAGSDATYGNKVQYLVIGGGGGGGFHGGSEGAGAGGAGGYRTNGAYDHTVTAQAYSITVGGGGAGNAETGDRTGDNGGSSTFDTITSAGGGGGGCGQAYYPMNGKNGGSGGGAGQSGTGGTGNTPSTTPSQGNNGASGTTGKGGGGGGGAGGSASQSSTANGGAGGAGVNNSITGSSVGYAGGGGGGANYGYSGGSATHGGGAGGGSSTSGSNGTANTGGGGGGSGRNGATGGNGGSGVVILRYKYQ